MGFIDRLRGGNSRGSLPRGARVVRRQRRNGGSDVGYYSGSTFYLIDGAVADDVDYTGGGEVLGTTEARNELADAGYDSTGYSAPSSSSYDGGSGSSYGGGSSYDSGSSYSGGGSSYDSGSSYSSGGSSYDSGSSSGGYSSGGSSYDSGSSSSSSDSGSSW